MPVIDLTHTIKETMPVYPGTQPPRLETANTYEKDLFKETLITMFSHTGTPRCSSKKQASRSVSALMAVSPSTAAKILLEGGMRRILDLLS